MICLNKEYQKVKQTYKPYKNKLISHIKVKLTYKPYKG